MTLATTAAAFYEAGVAVYCFVDHWQSLIGGALGAGAAIAVVRFTLNAERRKADAEERALRVALGAEVRLIGEAAISAFSFLFIQYDHERTLYGSQLSGVVIFPRLLIGPSAGLQFGLLGADALATVDLYGKLTAIEQAVQRFMLESRGGEVWLADFQYEQLMIDLLNLAKLVTELLPALTGVSSRAKDEDDRFRQVFAEAWNKWVRTGPPSKPRAGDWTGDPQSAATPHEDQV